MNTFYSTIEKSEIWNTEMDILKQVSNLIEEGEIISKSSCYYPRFKESKKRGRVAFIELFKKLAYNNMNISHFELFVCKKKDWKIHIQPTDKYGSMCADWILETEYNSDTAEYLNRFELLKTPTMPSITTKEEKIDNVSAIKNLASNLEITGEDAIQIIKYFLAGLEQLSSPGGNP